MEQKFDVIFVDLDSTIYDTSKFREDMFQIFSPLGITREEFFLSYREAAEAPLLGYFNYTFKKQIEAVRNRGYAVPDEILAKLEEVLNNDYLYSDAPFFLSYLKRFGEKIILLTAGNRIFQREKVDNTKSNLMVDDVMQVDGGKDLALAPFVKTGQLLAFINDNLDENIMIKNQYPGVTVVTKFNPDYWIEEQCEKSGLPWFKTLTEITKYLDKKYEA